MRESGRDTNASSHEVAGAPSRQRQNEGCLPANTVKGLLTYPKLVRRVLFVRRGDAVDGIRERERKREREGRGGWRDLEELTMFIYSLFTLD